MTSHLRLPARVAALLAAGALSASALAATAAKADAALMTRDGCSIFPRKPTILPHLDLQGRKQAQYQLSVSCSANRTIHITQDALEQDNGKPGDVGGDDLIKHAQRTWTPGPNGGTRTFQFTVPVDPLETDGSVELYHRVKFNVVSVNDSDDPVTGSETPYEKSFVLVTSP